MVFNLFGTSERRRSLTPGDKKALLLLAKGCYEYCGKSITAKGMSENIHHIKRNKLNWF
jgi:hypothetical protein